MHDKLSVVLSNYNGNRESLNLNVPRYKVTIDSFMECVPYYKDLNVLLLDNNSNDNSERIIEEYIDKVSSPKWRATFKDTEDFYLGTLYRLVAEYDGQFDYLMLVDNDHFFFQKRDFLGQVVAFMENNPECIAFQLNAVTFEDVLDHYFPHLSWLQRWLGHRPKAVVGLFDECGYASNGNLMLRGLNARRAVGVEHMTLIDGKKGGVIFKYPGYPRKRLCWLSFAAHNIVLRVSALKEVFQDPILLPPYVSNADRLALFASRIGQQGDTWYFQHGASINFGFRKYVLTERLVDVVKLLERYRHEPQQSLYTKNGYSFFVRDKCVLADIEVVVTEATSGVQSDQQ